MKVIVAGSREINDRAVVARAIQSSPFKITELVSGTARGVDSTAENYALTNNIPVKKFPADWDKYGKPAGAIRNQKMAEYADGLIAVWDGQSAGTKSMIKIMNKVGKPVHIYLTDK
jgi:hypothetical protein